MIIARFFDRHEAQAEQNRFRPGKVLTPNQQIQVVRCAQTYASVPALGQHRPFEWQHFQAMTVKLIKEALQFAGKKDGGSPLVTETIDIGFRQLTRVVSTEDR